MQRHQFNVLRAFAACGRNGVTIKNPLQALFVTGHPASKTSHGVPVSVVGYLAAIKPQDHGSGESTNCPFINPEEVEHIPLVEKSGDPESTSIVVEATPRVRETHPKWTPQILAPWVLSAQPVRISGWTMLDPEHEAHVGRFRSTLWEIHPITKIKVFKDGQWMDVDHLP